MEDGVSHDAEIEIGDNDDAKVAGYDWFRNYIEACPGLKAAGAGILDIESISEVVDGETKYHLAPWL